MNPTLPITPQTVKNCHDSNTSPAGLPDALTQFYRETLEQTVPQKLEQRRQKGKPEPRLANNPLVGHQKLLAALLGKSLLETYGQSFFDAVEAIRTEAQGTRRIGEGFNQEALVATIQRLANDMTQEEQIGDAFRMFLTLTQIANAIVTTSSMSRMASLNLQETLPSESAAYVDQVTPIRVVTTMHPTDMANADFTRAVNLLFRHYKAFTELAGTSEPNSGELQYQKKAIEEAMTALLKAQFNKLTSPTVADEINQNLSYFNTIYKALPRLYQSVSQRLGSAPTKPLFVMGTWVGGDMDGNPNVVPQTLDTALSMGAIEIARLYRASLKKMEDAALANQLFNVSNELHNLRQTLNTERITLLQAAQNKANTSKVTALEQLTAEDFKTLPTPEHFIAALDAIFNKLETDTQGLTLSAGLQSNIEFLKARYQKLVYRVQTFGFHFASVDIRQEAGMVHKNALRLIPSNERASLLTEGSELPDDAQLGRADWQKQAVTAYHKAMTADLIESTNTDNQSTDILPMLRLAKSAQVLLGNDACHNVILSLTQSAADVMATMLLLKQAGLLTVENNQVTSSHLDITPLFEKSAALASAKDTMVLLFENPLYQSHLKQRGMKQLVLLGYSDGIKDAGLLSNAWLMYKSQRELIALAKQYGVKLEFYYGRGGNPIRGGGSTDRAVNSIAPGSFDFPHHLTEQGEILARYYSIPEMATMRLNQALTSVLQKADLDNNDPALQATDASAEKLFDALAQSVRTHYQGLLRLDGFLSFYNQLTPNETGFVYRGSRPSTRDQGVPNLTNIRAIPWVFQWTQARLLLPGWYGLGSAFQDYLAAGDEQERLKQLTECYKVNPLFKNTLDNSALTLHQADFSVAQYYFDQLVTTELEVSNNFMARIADEYHLTRRWIQSIIETAQGDATNAINPWHDDAEQTAWQQRQAYIDPLHIMQVNTLKAFRLSLTPGADKSEKLAKFEPYRNLFTIATGGIAAGMGTTG